MQSMDECVNSTKCHDAQSAVMSAARINNLTVKRLKDDGESWWKSWEWITGWDNWVKTALTVSEGRFLSRDRYV